MKREPSEEVSIKQEPDEPEEEEEEEGGGGAEPTGGDQGEGPLRAPRSLPGGLRGGFWRAGSDPVLAASRESPAEFSCKEEVGPMGGEGGTNVQ